jgi:signal transduction histidine kinase
MAPGHKEAPVILVIDDDPVQRHLCRQALEGAGFAVEEAGSGVAGIEIFTHISPDAILLDVVMPGMDGFTTCSRLRARENERSTPILMVTGLDDVASIERAYTAGATDFISKPFNWTILVQRIRYMLRANDTLYRLQLSERRLAEAERTAALGNFIVPKGARTIECSAGLLRLLGREGAPPAHRIRPILRHIPRADRTQLMRAFRSTVAGATHQSDYSIRIAERPLGHVAIRFEIVEDRGGGWSVHGTVQDITDRKAIEADLKAARDEAERADEAKTMFMANMSHELRTPLNAIIGFSTLISSQVFGDIGNPKYLDYATDIGTAGEHMHALVEDILTMTRLDMGHYVLAPDSFDLRELAQSTITLFRGTRIAEDREVRLTDGKAWPTIEADERAVRQMILNLLSNAVKFSAKHEPVEVACGRGPAGSVRLSVIDKGIGMTEAEAALALVPFQQVDGRIARKYEGAGLGLSIVKKLIELHGGSIQIESRPNVGTSVTLNFPATVVCPETPLGREASPFDLAADRSG